MRWSGCCAASAAGTTQTARFRMARALPQRRREHRLGTLFRSRGQRQLLQRCCPGHWTEELAADFTAGLDVAAGRVLWHVWRAGERGIHRDVLCQRADLSPVELRSLLIRMGRVLRRFQRERGMALSRPMAANSPLQSYFVDPDFARGGVRSVQRDDAGPVVQWLAAPLTNACHRAPGRTNRAWVVEHADDNDAPIDVKLRC